MQLAIVFAILAVIIPLVLYSLRLSYSVKSDREFFQGVHTLSARELFDTLAASWLMLGNVFLACLVFGKYYGDKNWWLVLTWLLAFVLMMKHVGSVSKALTTHHTLHSFLFESFSSRMVRTIAALITAATGLGIIALESIVVMALLVPVAGNAAPWLPFAAGFAILLTLAIYSVLGGFTAVTSTDTYQLYGVIAGLCALVVIMLRALFAGIVSTSTVWAAKSPTFSSTGTSPLWFFAGIFFLQVPLFLGDFGTWQRVKACAPHSISDQQKTFGKLGIANAIAWAILLIAGIFLAAIPAGTLTAYPNSFLYNTAGPIVDFISLSSHPGQFGGQTLNIILVIVLVVGLVCAMMSTSDSYLLITIQTFYDDILPDSFHGKKDGTSGIQFARLFAIVGVVLAFGIAVYVVVNKANFLPIISLFFSLQASLAPLAVLALYYPQPDRFRLTAILTLIVTCVGCILYTRWALFIVDGKTAIGAFHQVNVTFILPVVSFLLPFFFLFVHIAFIDGPRCAVRWVMNFPFGSIDWISGKGRLATFLSKSKRRRSRIK